MTIATKIETFMRRSSWIRKMFEEGAQLKAEYGFDDHIPAYEPKTDGTQLSLF